MADPTIANLDGNFTYRSPNGTYRIDQGADAVVTDADNDLATLEVLFWWGETDGSIGIHTEPGKVSIDNGVISVAGIPIGQIMAGSDPTHLMIGFNDDATPERVQELVRALTYTNSSSTNGFRDYVDIGIFLRDKAGAEAIATVSIADKVSGTEGSDVFSSGYEAIDFGDELDGGAGDDVFELTGGGSFDLHRMGSIANIETIRGSAGDDFITIQGAHLSGLRSIESGGTVNGDTLTITGTATDLSGIAVEGFKSIALAADGAGITVDDVATAKLVTGYETKNDTLVLTSGSLTALERQILHQQGIDTIITKDVNGQNVTTTHRAPQITSFHGATVKAPIGTAVFLDAGQDAILTADSILLKSLFIHVDGPADPTERIEVATGDGVTLSRGHTYLEVSIGGLVIGRADGVGTPSVSFIFNDQATYARVQKLVRSLTYTKTDGTAGDPRKIDFHFKDVGGREMNAEITVALSPMDPLNVAPTDIGLSGASVREASPDNTWIGDLSATDASGSTFTYSLVNDAGGRFKIDGSRLQVSKGILLDYEQAKSHTIRIKVTDQGGLSFEKTFTIDVADDAKENVIGSAGDDVFRGGAGSDKFAGGGGNDRLTGGKGKDTFVFNAKLDAKKNVDTIADFNPKDDLIQLENNVFKKLKKTGALKKDYFTVGSKAKDKDDYIVYDRKKGSLSYDADGSGKGKAVLFAKLQAGLDHKDFFVI